MTDAKRNAVDLEHLSEIFDGENIQNEQIKAQNNEAKARLQNWSLIGSALRDELPSKIDLSFADKVMAAVDKEPAVQLEEQPQEHIDTSKFKVSSLFKKASMYVAQIAVAASVAMVTIVGWQTYSAGDLVNSIEPASPSSLGAVGGLNLASFQTDDHEAVIHMNQIAAPNPSANTNNQISAQQLEQLRQQEIERVNSYVRGYVLNTALN